MVRNLLAQGPPAAPSSLRDETTDWFSSFFILTAELMHLFGISAVVSSPDWCGMGRLKLYPERVRSLHDQNFTKGIKAPPKAPGSQELQLWPTTG